MSDKTTIEWTDASYNPWQGCLKVSPGCDHCYAESLAQRWGRDFSDIHRSAPATFNAPLRWKEPRRVFTCSISDFFIRQADPWRAAAWDIMRRTPHLTYQLLTKRPGRAVAWYQQHGWLPNVWLGTSVESAKYLPRLDVLARVPAPIRFLSAEPLLAPVDLRKWLQCGTCLGKCGWAVKPGLPPFDKTWQACPACDRGRILDWVICGSESGSGRRPFNKDWARSIRDQCQAAGTPFFFKQGGGLYPGQDRLLDGRTWDEIPAQIISA